MGWKGLGVVALMVVLGVTQHVGEVDKEHIESLEEERAIHSEYTESPGTFHPEPVPDTPEEPGLITQWSELIEGMEMSNLVTVEIQARTSLVLFDEIGYVPASLKGAYFSSSDENIEVNVKVTDPSQNIIYESNSKEGVFAIPAPYRGLYEFSFTNKQLIETVTLTIALHTSNSTQILNKDHISPIETGLLSIQTSVKDFQTDQEFAQIRQESHFKSNSLYSCGECESELVLVQSDGVCECDGGDELAGVLDQETAGYSEANLG